MAYQNGAAVCPQRDSGMDVRTVRDFFDIANAGGARPSNASPSIPAGLTPMTATTTTTTPRAPSRRPAPDGARGGNTPGSPRRSCPTPAAQRPGHPPSTVLGSPAPAPPARPGPSYLPGTAMEIAVVAAFPRWGRHAVPRRLPNGDCRIFLTDRRKSQPRPGRLVNAVGPACQGKHPASTGSGRGHYRTMRPSGLGS